MASSLSIRSGTIFGNLSGRAITCQIRSVEPGDVLWPGEYILQPPTKDPIYGEVVLLMPAALAPGQGAGAAAAGAAKVAIKWDLAVDKAGLAATVKMAAGAGMGVKSDKDLYWGSGGGGGALWKLGAPGGAGAQGDKDLFMGYEAGGESPAKKWAPAGNASAEKYGGKGWSKGDWKTAIEKQIPYAKVGGTGKHAGEYLTPGAGGLASNKKLAPAGGGSVVACLDVKAPSWKAGYQAPPAETFVLSSRPIPGRHCLVVTYGFSDLIQALTSLGGAALTVH